jgi:hypothetical protein
LGNPRKAKKTIFKGSDEVKTVTVDTAAAVLTTQDTSHRADD